MLRLGHDVDGRCENGETFLPLLTQLCLRYDHVCMMNYQLHEMVWLITAVSL